MRSSYTWMMVHTCSTSPNRLWLERDRKSSQHVKRGMLHLSGRHRRVSSFLGLPSFTPSLCDADFRLVFLLHQIRIRPSFHPPCTYCMSRYISETREKRLTKPSSFAAAQSPTSTALTHNPNFRTPTGCSLDVGQQWYVDHEEV